MNILPAAPATVYTHALLFNCWLFKADESIAPFIRKYLPLIRPRDLSRGGWTSHGADERNQKPHIPVMHSYMFEKHPFFEGRYSNGLLHFYSRECENVQTGIVDIDVHFRYRTREDAEYDLASLCSGFENAGCLKTVRDENAVLKISYLSPDPEQETYGEPAFYLYREPLPPEQFIICFSIRPSDSQIYPVAL